ncbi:PREDICTED: B-cell scaffold protein with ankyrin repeats [Miniopterus natalensis]|uniref:B-cell scaffold protein with ankyrin repeats n=1 Tax=Miniopterus natalensis TaxID=291302 RepID=UPI0007A712AF|nr:PREDICTED: B-cell scaffold protein with ankyrin repeats [Miniopterus natalensis]
MMIYEENAEEWALYLREVFSHTVKREAILLYCLENYSLRDLELQSLNSYECKLLILSDSLLKDLTPKKCQFLEKVLHPPESVVTLLCGVTSSDQLYKLLNISGGRWEISTEQGPEDYISVIESIIFGGSNDYLEVTIPTDLRVEPSGEVSERKRTEEFTQVSGSSGPLALVLPTEVPCENPGEIFIILRDEVIGDTVEVEFTSDNKCIRTRPALWNKTVWCMKALDFPAGSVNVNVYCDGIIKATTEIKYYTTEKAEGSLLGAAGPGDGVCQNDMEELDDILTFIFKQEIPYYKFRSPQTEICPQKEYAHFKELPTLLHCAAKFGLKNLAIHLLQCSGATWASQMENLEGSDPAHIAERHGHKELKKIFDDFSIQTISRNNEPEHDYEEDFPSLSAYFPTPQSPAWKMLEGQMERSQSWCNSSAKQETGGEPEGEEEKTEAAKELEEEDPYTFAEIDDSEYDMILANRSTKKKLGGRSFIINRPPAPTPRPTNIPPKAETTPYIAQVFRQKAARRQSDGDKFPGPRKQDRPRVESQAFSTLRSCLATGQEELILLQEQVKSGKLSMDQALKKFKQWQMGKTGLEIIQQEKLRQLRDCIIGKRPEEANVYDKLTIVHHPGGNESVHNENTLYNIPFGNKPPVRLQVEKEFGFCCRKDH